MGELAQTVEHNDGDSGLIVMSAFAQYFSIAFHGDTIPIQYRYDPSGDPAAITLRLPGTNRSNDWLFARTLLADGLVELAGEYGGDICIAPYEEEAQVLQETVAGSAGDATVLRRQPQINISLRSPTGQGALITPQRRAKRFLFKTYEAVAPDDESEIVMRELVRTYPRWVRREWYGGAS